jgi:hypothetical protein
MLIARMKTHPEEFATGGRLRYLVEKAARVANRQDTSMATVDAVAICEAMQSLYKQELTEVVIKVLLGAHAEDLMEGQMIVGQGSSMPGIIGAASQATPPWRRSGFLANQAGAANMQNGYYGASPQSAVTNTAASMSPLGTLLRSKLGDIF